MLNRLLLATRNYGKVRELSELLADLPLELIYLSNVSHVEDVAETGETFLENATLKASGYATQAGMVALADDSGLEVDVLGGAPGVKSARYGGQNSDAARVQLLLTELAKAPNAQRTARFVSVVAIANSDGSILNTSTGICEGR